MFWVINNHLFTKIGKKKIVGCLLCNFHASSQLYLLSLDIQLRKTNLSNLSKSLK